MDTLLNESSRLLEAWLLARERVYITLRLSLISHRVDGVILLQAIRIWNEIKRDSMTAYIRFG